MAASVTPVPINIKMRAEKKMTAVRRRKEKSAYIICVDVPCHVSIRNKLSVDVASDFAVPPAAVYVNYTDHVPLRGEKGVRQKRYSVIICLLSYILTLNASLV